VSFNDRPTGEILVLMIATTICGAVLVGSITIGVLAFIHPEVDYDGAARTIADLLTTMVGLLAGYLAGKSTS
jgi:hypothetical protein